MTSERLEELRAISNSGRWRCSECIRFIPELIAEIDRLRGELFGRPKLAQLEDQVKASLALVKCYGEDLAIAKADRDRWKAEAERLKAEVETPKSKENQ